MLIFKVMETIHNVGAHHLAGYVITLCVESKKIKAVFETAHGESRFPSGLTFPRLAKVISRRVWHFRAWRKSFPEWFGISAHGESRFPKGLAFPRMAKSIFQSV